MTFDMINSERYVFALRQSKLNEQGLVWKYIHFIKNINVDH